MSLLKDDGSVPIAMAKPWRSAFRRLCRRPTSDRGPVLFWAFFRLEAVFRSEVISLFRGFGELTLDDVRGSLEAPRKRLAIVL